MRLSFFSVAVTILSISFFACNNSSKTDRAIIAAMEESLVSSNKYLHVSTQSVLASLEDKMSDPVTHEKAKVWFPKAEKIQDLSEKLHSYIEKLKGKKVDKETAITLFEKIQGYKTDILSTDSLIKETFEPYIKIDNLTAPAGATKASFFASFLKNASSSSVTAFLGKLQNSVKVTENKIVVFCHEQVPNAFCGLSSYVSAIIGQSSKIVTQGDVIEIIAGVGSFERRTNPEITINEKLITLNDYGNARYQLKANNKPGNYSIPVRISYTDQDAKKQIIETTVKYTVAKICDE